MTAKDRKVIINKDWCKGCGICVAFCPKNVLALDHHDKIEVANRDACILCGQCELRCPDFAIWLGGEADE
ncbi:MAG: 4Fe-4S binding protein [Clostridiales bacterium]|nr:4Fe-4S binding protein [Clostridiales bacterium]